MIKNIVNSEICLKCKQCCIFMDEKDAALAPYLSEHEYDKFPKKSILSKKNSFYQIKVIKSKKRKGCYVCYFLDESTHKCKIYNKRPFDCLSWPLVISYDEKRKHIYLCVVNKNWCPAIKSGIKIKKSKKIDNILLFFYKNGIIKEIENKKRFVWPYKKYHIKLKKIL